MKSDIPAMWVALTVVVSAGTAVAFTENAGGVRWTSASSESWSSSSQPGLGGGELELAGASDASVDSNSESGGALFVGLLPPIAPVSVETPTPTATATATATATVSPTGTFAAPSPTPTSCLDALLASDFDLDGFEGVDARDLLLLYEALKDGEGNPYDFNCDDLTDILDLLQFSLHWKSTDP